MNQAEREQHQEARRGLQEALARTARAEAEAASAVTTASNATDSAAEREALLRDFAGQVLRRDPLRYTSASPPCARCTPRRRAPCIPIEHWTASRGVWSYTFLDIINTY